jgi:hypothetical protein
MDSVWRYDKYYKEDSKDCPQCAALWESLHKRHEEDISNLKKHIADHVKQGDW